MTCGATYPPKRVLAPNREPMLWTTVPVTRRSRKTRTRKRERVPGRRSDAGIRAGHVHRGRRGPNTRSSGTGDFVPTSDGNEGSTRKPKPAARVRQSTTSPWNTSPAKAVCVYEKARGRDARQMAQTHPGYDIVSHDPITGEDRLIEVKGVDGEWNQTGVGLSRLQFSNAQDYGVRYWLYVVEFALDGELARVHAIKDPAKQVTSFMFDGNWREAATIEQPDPLLVFVPGRPHPPREHGGPARFEAWSCAAVRSC